MTRNTLWYFKITPFFDAFISTSNVILVQFLHACPNKENKLKANYAHYYVKWVKEQMQLKDALQLIGAFSISHGRRQQRGRQGDLCQLLQHMGSKTLELAELGRDAVTHFPSSRVVKRRPDNIFRYSVLGSTNPQTILLQTAHSETIESAFFIKPVKVT